MKDCLRGLESKSEIWTPESLKVTREIKGYSREKFGKIIGYSASSIYMYESGRVKIHAELQLLLSNILGDPIKLKLEWTPENLKETRIAKGYSRKYLGEKIGYSANSIDRCESGKTKINSKLQYLLSNILEAPISLKLNWTPETLRKTRKSKGYSVEKLGEKTGYSASSIYRFESGEVKINSKFQNKISEILGEPVS